MDDVTKPSDSGEVVPPSVGGDNPPTNMPEENTSVVSSDSNNNKGDKKSKKPMMIGLVVLLVALLAFGGWWFFMKDKKSASTPTETAVVKNDIAVLKYGTQDGPVNTFYPEPFFNSAAAVVNTQVFEGLVGYENETRIVPLLATSWTNPDDNTWVFTLKDGVKFHSGNPMTAETVKGSIEAAMAVEDFATYTSTISTVTVDSGKVVIKTKSPDPVLLNKLSRVYIFDTSLGAKGDPNAGSGPYNVKTGTTPTEDTIALTAVDNYHAGHVYVKELDIKVYPSDETLSADITNGTLDLADLLGETAVEGFHAFKVGDVSVTSLFAATKKPNSPMAKLKVRQAVQLALDQEPLLAADGADGTPANQIVTQVIPGYNPDIQDVTRDVAKAKSLLTEAGYPNGVTISIGGGKPAQDLITKIQSQLAEAGITVKPTLANVSSFGAFVDLIKNNTYDAWVMGWGSSIADLSDVVSDVYLPTGAFAQYDNPEVNDLAAKASTNLDQTSRLTQLQKISSLLVADVASAAIRTRSYPYLVRNNIVISRDLPVTEIGVYFYKTYSK